MPSNPRSPTIPSAMPSRVTSAFIRTVRVLLHERASDYVMWTAGHGADSATIATYLESLNVFPSHFDQWAENLGRGTILASLPILRSLMPGLTAPSNRTTAEARAEDEAHPVEVPPVIAAVVTLAIQQHIMAKQRRWPRTTARFPLSGLQRPQDHIELLSTNFGCSPWKKAR